MRHISYDDFSGGLDLRDDVFSKSRTRFRKLENFYINTGKKLTRRPPLIFDGNLDAKSQGTVKLNGKLYTIAKKGDTITHTGLAAQLVTTLYFDNPDYCTTWQLVHARVFNGVVLALIRHTFPGTLVTSQLKLHVFDGLTGKPTYVEDPYCPTSWKPSLPLHAYGQGTAGAFLDYAPYIGVGGTRAWMPRPDGNVQYSKLGNARQWNTRSVNDVLQIGELYYYVIPTTGAQVFNFVVSSAFADLALDQRWSAYVLEYLDATGTWQKFQEDAAPPTLHAHYYPADVASRFAGQPDEIQLQVNWQGAPDTVIRFRLIAGPPPVSIVTGCQISANNSVQVTADGSTYQFQTAVDYSEFVGYWSVYLDSVLQTASSPADYTVLNVNGKAKIQFAYDINNVGIGTFGPLDWTSGIDYAASTDAVGVKVYLNGTIVAGTSYDLSNVGGKLHIHMHSAWNGALEIIRMPNNNSAVKFARGGVVITAGTIKFEGQSINVPAVSLASLTLNREYLLGIVVPGQSYPNVVDIGAAGTQQAVLGNGLQRYYTFVSTLAETTPVTPVTIVQQTQYYYGSDAQLPSSWFLAKQTAYLLNDVGVLEAGSLTTSAYSNAGGTILAISGILNRLAFHFAGATVLWAVDQAQAAMSYLDSIPFGVGTSKAPQPVSYYDGALLVTPTGPRLVFLVGVNSQSMQDTNIGLPIERYGVINQVGAVFWPWLGLYVTAGTVNGQALFQVVSYSREAEITAWAVWKGAGIGAIDPYSLCDIDSKLYLRSGTALYHFDALPAAYRDDNDGLVPYESRAELHFDPFGDPQVNKKILGAAFSQNGTCTLLQALLPYDTARTVQLCRATGVTYGQDRIPLRVRGNGVASIISSVDPTVYVDANGHPQGYTLNQFGLDVEEARPASRR